MSSAKDCSNSAILKYLTESNRPYSVNDIVSNLHKEYGKTAVTKALEVLVENGKVIEKVYGKQKVYFRNQNDLPVSCEQLTAIDLEIVCLTQKLKEAQEIQKQTTAELDALNSSLSLEQLNERIEKAEKLKVELKSKAERIKQKVGCINAVDFQNTHQELQRRNSSWKSRKRIATTTLDIFSDGFPKDKKALLEEIGVDEDND